MTLDEVAEHAAALDRATDLPISIDLENGYGAEPESAALAVTQIAEAGAVGASIEDYDPDGFVYDLPMPSRGSKPPWKRRAGYVFRSR